MIEELADPWLARCESLLDERRGGARQRAAGAGPKYDLVFTDRVLVTLVYLRTGLPHAALAELYGTARSTVSRAIGEIRPLPAAHGLAVPDRPQVRLRTLADVFAYAETEGITLRIDGAETQVHRSRTNRPGRRAYVSGKKKQNTIKTTTISDGQGRLLWSGADRPGRMHDQTAMRTEGIADQFRTRTGRGRRGLPGPGQRVPHPGQRPAEEAEGRRPARRAIRLAGDAPPTVLRSDLRRAHQRRTATVAPAPARYRPTR